MKSVLVTGGNGQLGRCIKDVVQSSKELNFIFTDKNKLDITKEEDVKAFFENNSISYCINCAAYTAVDKAETDKDAAEALNIHGVENLANVCKKHKAILIHISTDFVFDGKQTKPYTEADETKPLNVYGETKLKGEKVVAEVLEDYFIIRTSWLYSEYGNNFFKTMLRLASEKNEVRVVSDQMGTPTYARDLARAVIVIIEKKKTAFGLYHYSNEGITSWFDFAITIFDYSNIKTKILPVKAKDFMTSANRPLYSVIDKTKIKDILGIAIPHWKESLKKCLINLAIKK
ncbi:dTDP-4-dehydrorhamnose reductase [Croceitalea marina]|uniref:dTDP-4-dehydrorhamnose reductase n=1 Tax=Croceitalea marina TaxID=1775166 RepID=A0ABW5MZT8_9FLAO